MSSSYSRRKFLAAAAAAGLAGCGPRKTAAGGCPGIAGERIRWIVPYSPGGPYDAFSRLLETSFESATGTEIVILNEPGGGGLLGAAQLRDAAPDGRTLGIVNGFGLLHTAVSSSEPYPNPAHDFDILGKLQRRQYVVVTGASSNLHHMTDLFARQRERPLVVGLVGIASSQVLIFAALESMLGLKPKYVAGYQGSREAVLGVMRGETDLAGAEYESVQSSVESGELRVLLQVSNGPIADAAGLANAVWLGGKDGAAMSRASEIGADPRDAQIKAEGFIDLVGIGVLAAAPRGLPADLLACLRARLQSALESREFTEKTKAARRSVDFMSGDRAQAEIAAAEARMGQFAPLARDLKKRVF
jgi:tripartite-type tricarboxylate transporter receptor subunit TctC